MEEKIIRPTTKPEAVKGKLLKYQGTDYCEFMPQAQGEPQYEGISKTRNSQLKRSKGKAPKLVAHLTAKAESIDPYADTSLQPVPPSSHCLCPVFLCVLSSS